MLMVNRRRYDFTLAPYAHWDALFQVTKLNDALCLNPSRNNKKDAGITPRRMHRLIQSLHGYTYSLILECLFISVLYNFAPKYPIGTDPLINVVLTSMLKRRCFLILSASTLIRHFSTLLLAVYSF